VVQLWGEAQVLFANEIKEKYEFKIEYIDMGGGFPKVDSLSAYVDAIVDPIVD